MGKYEVVVEKIREWDNVLHKDNIYIEVGIKERNQPYFSCREQVYDRPSFWEILKRKRITYENRVNIVVKRMQQKCDELNKIEERKLNKMDNMQKIIDNIKK